jgi:four helix bundle protein
VNEVQGQGPRAKGQGFRELVAWQKAHQLALAVFRTTQPLSRDQGWLVRQLTRAAVSVPANIAEGYSRESLLDYLRYLQIARGSLAETEYYLLFLRDSKLLDDDAVSRLESARLEVGNVLIGLIRALRAKAAAAKGSSARTSDRHAAYGPRADREALGPWPLALGPVEQEP